MISFPKNPHDASIFFLYSLVDFLATPDATLEIYHFHTAFFVSFMTVVFCIITISAAAFLWEFSGHQFYSFVITQLSSISPVTKVGLKSFVSFRNFHRKCFSDLIESPFNIFRYCKETWKNKNKKTKILGWN